MKILKFTRENLKEVVGTANKSLRDGCALVYPTDTVYGLIGDVTNKKAVEKIFKIKKRPKGKPLPVFIRDLKMVGGLANLNNKQEAFLAKAWPGKTTARLERKKAKIKLYGVEEKTIALRIPDYKLVLELLRKANRPLAGTSANLSGQPPSGRIKDVLKQFREKRYQPDLVIDAGNLPKSRPSKVIDLTVFPYKVLRQ